MFSCFGVYNLCFGSGADFTGLAFGTGSAVAHRAVDAVVGPRTIQHEHVGSDAAANPVQAASMNGFSGSDACNIHSKAFQDVCVVSFLNIS